MRRGKQAISGGRFAVRKKLYMAALVSIRYNDAMRMFYERLRNNGKQAKVALVAVMHKIIVILNSMVKNNCNWDVTRYIHTVKAKQAN